MTVNDVVFEMAKYPNRVYVGLTEQTSDTGSREMNYVEVADKICSLFYVRAKRE